MTSDSKRLIVNADDFGLSAGVNRGIVEVHRHGIVTSASLMVRWPAAAEAVRLWQDSPDLSLGLHVDLGEWAYRNGAWQSLYEVVSLDDEAAVRREVLRQWERFAELTQRSPAHVDSHQHVHREGPARSVLEELAAEAEIPLRHFTPRVQYCGEFYGQSGRGIDMPSAISVEALLKILTGLPSGITELACHPGLDDQLETMYCLPRAIEVKTLCDPRVREAIKALDIELCGFQDLVPQEPVP